MIELRHLQTLIALAESGNLAGAASRVGLTVSALSHQIKAVESHYDAVLFERKSSPLHWSPVGERLVALGYDVSRAVKDAEREVSRILDGRAGQLRIAVECHSCFEWLMPAMDAFRENWDEVELDLVSGFHPDPVELLLENRADVVIVSRKKRRAGVDFHPLFGYRMPAILANDHPLTRKKHLTPRDFATDTLITYPIPDERLDLFRQVLGPAKIDPPRRTAMLTEAILQLVASRRGIAALPDWAIQPFLDRGYVTARPIGAHGLSCELHAATTLTASRTAYIADFLRTMREHCFRQLRNIDPISTSPL